jgi:hypothetical protein
MERIRLDRLAKTRELILQHELDMKRLGKENDIQQLKDRVRRLEEINQQ